MPGVEVTNLAYVNNDEVWLSWNHSTEERVRIFRVANVVICAYFPTGARIHLYGYFDRLRENAVKCDMDYFIFI